MLECLMFMNSNSPAIKPGDFYKGGYYVGKIAIDSSIYELILSPVDTVSLYSWKTTNTYTPGADSLNNGWNNTQAMFASGIENHPAARYCYDLVINDYDDWYLPAADELEMCYRVFKPGAQSNAIQQTGAPNGAMGYNPSSIPIGQPYTLSDPGQTSVEQFKYEGPQAFFMDYFYLASTQKDEGNSAEQWFYSGYQKYGAKTNLNYVRAVRRELVQ